MTRITVTSLTETVSEMELNYEKKKIFMTKINEHHIQVSKSLLLIALTH